MTAMVGLGEGARYLVEYPADAPSRKDRGRLRPAGRRPRRRLQAARRRSSKMRPAVQQTLGNSNGSRQQRRIRLLAGRVRSCHHDSLPAASFSRDDLNYVSILVSDRAYTYTSKRAFAAAAVERSWWPLPRRGRFLRLKCSWKEADAGFESESVVWVSIGCRCSCWRICTMRCSQPPSSGRGLTISAAGCPTRFAGDDARTSRSSPTRISSGSELERALTAIVLNGLVQAGAQAQSITPIVGG